VIALKGTAALWSPKVLRAGMGAHFGLRLIESADPSTLDALAVPLVVTSSHQGELSAPPVAALALCLGHGP
jgi:TrmH family RNA methyltransferase